MFYFLCLCIHPFILLLYYYYYFQSYMFLKVSILSRYLFQKLPGITIILLFKNRKNPKWDLNVLASSCLNTKQIFYNPDDLICYTLGQVQSFHISSRKEVIYFSNGQYYLNHRPCTVTYTSLLLWLKFSFGFIYDLKTLGCSAILSSGKWGFKSNPLTLPFGTCG